MSLVIVIFLSILTAFFWMLGEYFLHLSPKSLKSKSSRIHDKIVIIKDLVSHAQTVNFYMKVLSMVFGVWLVIYIGRQSDGFWQAFFTIIVVLIIINFVSKFYTIIRPIAVLLSPYIYRFSKIADGPTRAIRGMIERVSLIPNDGLDKDELINLINSQKPDDELTRSDIDLSILALKFGVLKVKDFYTPRKVVKFLDVDSDISTVVMDDLYKSGFSRFPVYSETPDNIVGTLYLKDLVEKRFSGKVSKVMSSEVYDIRDDSSLEEALRKFIKTKHHLFIVENEFQEIMGVITLEDVLEQLIGKEIVDESDVHEDMRDVAKE